MIKRQRTMIILLAIVFAALTAVYFIVVRPMTQSPEDKLTDEETAPGEGIEYGRKLIFPHMERKDMQSIEVKNPYGEYKFVYDEEADDFYIDGYENLAYDATTFARLVTSVGFTLTVDTVTYDATEKQLAEYGFTGEDVETSQFTLTTRSGEKHTVILGNKIISGGGYYAMYEGRDAIYILDSSIEKTVLLPVENMVSPMLTAGIVMTSYYKIDHFTIKHYGEDFLTCRRLTEEELSDGESVEFAKTVSVYPAEYALSTHYDETLQSLCNFTGESVAALGLTAENLEKFGLADVPYEISYEYDGFTFKLTASEPVDGYYYVATSIFNIIVKVPEADFEFLTWDLIYWVEKLPFSRNITTVESITIDSKELTETFRLRHYPTAKPNLGVLGDKCGEIDDPENFRQFYKTLLLFNIEDYAPEDENIISEDNRMLTFTVRTTSGKETVYSFYRYSTRRCLLTIDGKGQFYVLADTVAKIISDAGKVIDGVPVDATSKN